jgi:hypothetical protein
MATLKLTPNKTVLRSELSKLKMVAGNERKYRKVIVDRTVMEWVGIGWIILRPASGMDHDKFPVVVDELPT